MTTKLTNVKHWQRAWDAVRGAKWLPRSSSSHGSPVPGWAPLPSPPPGATAPSCSGAAPVHVPSALGRSEPGSPSPGRPPAVRTRPRRGQRGGPAGDGEGGGRPPPGRGRRPGARTEPRLHQTAPPQPPPDPQPPARSAGRFLTLCNRLLLCAAILEGPRGRARRPPEQARRAARAARRTALPGACAQRHPLAEAGQAVAERVRRRALPPGG